MKSKTIAWIGYPLFLLVFVSCLIGIFNNDIYQDGEWANAQWLGQDIVTVLFALPILFIALRQSINNKNWELILCGIFFYFVYSYAFYVFVAKLTFLYLFHLPIFALSVFGVFITLKKVLEMKEEVYAKNKVLNRSVIIYLLFISAMLVFIWLSDIVSHLTIKGYQSDTPSGEAPLIIYSLDLAIVIPLMLVSAIGLWNKQQHGIKLTGIMLTKTSTLGFALMGMSLSMYLKEINNEPFLIILWFVIGLLGTLLTVLFFQYLKKSNTNETI